MTDYTPNYHLPLYEDFDKPNLRDQYNGAMGLIDSQFKAGETDLTTVQNLIAGINRDITTINESIESANTQISALQTLTTNQGATLTEQGEDITKAQSDITANAQGLATQGGYWSALGVSNLDEAIDLHSDIDDAHTQSMANQADIAQLKIKDAAHDSSMSTINGQVSTLQTTVAANTQGLTIANTDIEQLYDYIEALQNDWEVTDIATPALYQNHSGSYFWGKIFVNTKKTLFKVAAFGSLAYAGPQPAEVVTVPGTSNTFAFKLVDGVLENVATPLVYTGVGWYACTYLNTASTFPVNVTPNTIQGQSGLITLYIGTDGALYCDAHWGDEKWRGSVMYITQAPLTLNNLHIEPPTPIEPPTA